MAKSVFTAAYASALAELVALRKERGLTQAELAERLGKPQQFVSRYELSVRRVDVVEFYAIAKALGVDPVEAFARAVRGFPEVVVV